MIIPNDRGSLGNITKEKRPYGSFSFVSLTGIGSGWAPDLSFGGLPGGLLGNLGGILGEMQGNIGGFAPNIRLLVPPESPQGSPEGPLEGL